MFYIYEDFRRPPKEIYCVGCSVCWPGAVALVGYFARFFYSFRSFIIIIIIIFESVFYLYRSSASFGRDSSDRFAKERKKSEENRCRSDTMRLRTHARMYIHVRLRSLLPIICGLSWLTQSEPIGVQSTWKFCTTMCDAGGSVGGWN